MKLAHFVMTAKAEGRLRQAFVQGRETHCVVAIPARRQGPGVLIRFSVETSAKKTGDAQENIAVNDLLLPQLVTIVIT